MSVHVRRRCFDITRRVVRAAGGRGLVQRRLYQGSNAYISAENVSTGGDNPSKGEFGFLLAIKDNIAAKGTSTTCASQILATNEIPFNATIVQQLLDRGAVRNGKTNMDEFGMGSHSTASAYGAVSNVSPLEERSAGGSSGGSAVAVASGTVDLALGTDTGGSVRLPAAYTNTVGFKPSYGMLSRWGVVPYANSLDTVGVLARRVTPIAQVINERGLYLEHDPSDPTSLPTTVRERCTRERQFYGNNGGELRAGDKPLSGLTFGIPLEYNIAELDPRIRDGWTAATEKIQNLGGSVVPVSLPSTENALSAYYIIAPAEAASNLSKYDGVRYGTRSGEETSDALDGVLYAKTRGTGFGDEVKRRILLGTYTLSSEAIDNYFIQAQKIRQLVRRDFDRVFRLSNPLHDENSFDLSDMEETVVLQDKLGPAQVDFLVCPTAPTPPPRLDEVLQQTPLDAYMNDVFTVPASLAGIPAISIPMDIPVDTSKDEESSLSFGGLQLIGQYWDDARLLAVADRLSTEVSEHMRRECEDSKQELGQGNAL